MSSVTRIGCGIVVGAVVGLGAGSVTADEYGDPFMRDMKQTVYATERHMTFSMRASVIRWLGGVPVVDDKDIRAAERDRWWGPAVPHVPPGSPGPVGAPR
jgi:hypothetical protein